MQMRSDKSLLLLFFRKEGLSFFLFFTLTTSALAHAKLQWASPPPGATIHAAPGSLVLLFSEAVEPRFCRVEVLNQAGAAEVAGSWHGDPKDAKRLLVPVTRLDPGTYTVHWRAVSVDTHKSDGAYQFTVAP